MIYFFNWSNHLPLNIKFLRLFKSHKWCVKDTKQRADDADAYFQFGLDLESHTHNNCLEGTARIVCHYSFLFLSHRWSNSSETRKRKRSPRSWTKRHISLRFTASLWHWFENHNKFPFANCATKPKLRNSKNGNSRCKYLEAFDRILNEILGRAHALNFAIEQQKSHKSRGKRLKNNSGARRLMGCRKNMINYITTNGNEVSSIWLTCCWMNLIVSFVSVHPQKHKEHRRESNLAPRLGIIDLLSIPRGKRRKKHELRFEQIKPRLKTFVRNLDYEWWKFYADE